MMMKYVCFINEDANIEEIFLFPKVVHHDCFSEDIDFMRNQSYGDWNRIARRPVSAGFVRFVGGKVVCFGRSETLKLSSRPIDTEILNKQLGG